MTHTDWPLRASKLNLHVRHFINSDYKKNSIGEGLIDKNPAHDGCLYRQSHSSYIYEDFLFVS